MGIYNYNSSTLFSGSLGNDDMSNFGDYNVTIDAGEGKNTIKNFGRNALIKSGADDDYIYNSGGSGTVFAGGGNDLIENYGSYALIYGEGGNDTIYTKTIGDHSTIVGGAGDDLLKIYDYKDNNVILYAEGDGNDVVINTGIEGHFDATLSITKGSYTQVIDGNDLLVKVGNGSVRFKDMANTKVNVEGTAGTSTPSTEPTTTTTTSQTTSQTTTAVAQTTTTATTPTTTSDSSGSNIIINNYYGNNYNMDGNNGTIVIGSSVEGGVTNNTNIDNSKNIVISGNTWTYSGGDKVINNYQSNQVIDLSTDYTGIGLNGNSFYVNSSSGSLEIENARDKVIQYNTNGNGFASYSYIASGGGFLDGSWMTERSMIIGAENLDNQIAAGSGGSSLWGGNGGNDSLVGGAGYDEFFYAAGSGNDVIKNAGDDDVVNLLGVSLSQITYAEVHQSEISIGFNDGGHLQLQGQSATGFKLEGVTYTANRATGGWKIKN